MANNIVDLEEYCSLRLEELLASEEQAYLAELEANPTLKDIFMLEESNDNYEVDLEILLFEEDLEDYLDDLFEKEDL